VSISALEAAEIDAALLEWLELVDRIIRPNDADHADLGEMAGGCREESGGAAEHVVRSAKRCLDGIECHRAHNEHAHSRFVWEAVKLLMVTGRASGATYILSGAVTPRMRRPLRRTICAPRASASRARVTSSACSSTWCL